jgi:protease-4
MIPNLRGLYEDHLGITMDTVKTGRFSTMSAGGGQFFEFNEEEGALITQSIQEIYDIFKTRVSEGRKLDRAHVDTIAEGRVWLGNVAKEIGLVDELGGLNEAIASAANLAGLKKYKIGTYPETKSFEETLMKSLTGDASINFDMSKFREEMMKADLGEDLFRIFKIAKDIRQMKGAQMRLPYEIIIE